MISFFLNNKQYIYFFVATFFILCYIDFVVCLLDKIYIFNTFIKFANNINEKTMFVSVILFLCIIESIKHFYAFNHAYYIVNLVKLYLYYSLYSNNIFTRAIEKKILLIYQNNKYGLKKLDEYSNFIIKKYISFVEELC